MVDRRALRIGEGDRVLVIASAGDKALNAALWGAAEVMAVDTNPAQLALLDLKLAAIRSVDWDDVWRLFAIGRHPDHQQLYRSRLRPLLPQESRRYWDRWIGIFGVGLHRHGWIGFGTGLLRRALRLAAGDRCVRVILASADPISQERVWRRFVRSRLVGPGLVWRVGATAMVHLLTVNGAQRRRVINDGYVSAILGRVERRMGTCLVRRNPFWCLAVTGAPCAPGDEAPWLRGSNLQRLRERANRVRAVRGDVGEVLLARPVASLDAVDLFDVPDWQTEERNELLFAAAARALRPGGRLLVRSAARVGPRPASMEFAFAARRSRMLTELERTALYGSVGLYIRRDASEWEAASGCQGRACHPAPA